MLVVGVIFKAFALTGRKVDCWFTQGECPGLGASAPSGRVGGKLATVQIFTFHSPYFFLFLFFIENSRISWQFQ